LFEKGDALATQLGDPGVEISDAERNVIIHVSPWAREWLIALPHVPQERHVAEHDRSRRRAAHALRVERRESAIGAALHLTGSLGQGRGTGAPREYRRVEMLLVPELGTERILLEQMHVVEALGRMVAGVFYQGIVRTLHVREAPGAGGLHASGLGVG